MEEIRLWAPIVVALAALGWNVALFRIGARKAELTKLDGRIEAVAADLRQHKEDGGASRAAIADRLAQIEGRLEHLPDAASSHRMELAITEVRGELGVLSERMKPVAATAERVHEFLLEEAKARRAGR